jgi:hypothetical protein
MIKKPNVIADLAYLSLVLTLALVSLPSIAQAQSTCMYCRRADVTRTFMVQYSYCEASDTCLQDKWLYIDRPCSTGWKRGEDVKLMSCEPTAGLCHSFVSSSQARGQFLNHTETLASGEYCEINVDATAYVARVVLDDALTLGVEIDDYKIGDVYDVDQGKTKKIIVYNGDTSGAITFTLAFS